MTRSAYEQLQSGEWFDYDPKLDIACCDCGLVHRVQAKVVQENGKPRIKLRLSLRPLSTAALRRHHEHNCAPVKRRK